MNGIEAVESKPRFALTIEGHEIGVFEQEVIGKGFYELINVNNSRESMSVWDAADTRRHLPGPVDPKFQLSDKVVIIDISTVLKKRLGWATKEEAADPDPEADASDVDTNLDETA